MYKVEKRKLSKNLPLRPKQKAVKVKESDLRKLTKPSVTVFDGCVGSTATAKFCLPDSLYRKYVGYDVDNDWTVLIVASLSSVLANQKLSLDSDIEKDGKIDTIAHALPGI